VARIIWIAVSPDMAWKHELQSAVGAPRRGRTGPRPRWCYTYPTAVPGRVVGGGIWPRRSYTDMLLDIEKAGLPSGNDSPIG